MAIQFNLDSAASTAPDRVIVVQGSQPVAQQSSVLSNQIIANGKRLASTVLGENGDLCEAGSHRWFSSIAWGIVTGIVLPGHITTGLFVGHGIEDSKKLDRLAMEAQRVDLLKDRMYAGEQVSPKAQHSIQLQSQIMNRVQQYTATSKSRKNGLVVAGILGTILEATVLTAPPTILLAGPAWLGLTVYSLVQEIGLLHGRYASQSEARSLNKSDAFRLLGT